MYAQTSFSWPVPSSTPWFGHWRVRCSKRVTSTSICTRPCEEKAAAELPDWTQDSRERLAEEQFLPHWGGVGGTHVILLPSLETVAADPRENSSQGEDVTAPASPVSVPSVPAPRSWLDCFLLRGACSCMPQSSKKFLSWNSYSSHLVPQFLKYINFPVPLSWGLQSLIPNPTVGTRPPALTDTPHMPAPVCTCLSSLHTCSVWPLHHSGVCLVLPHFQLFACMKLNWPCFEGTVCKHLSSTMAAGVCLSLLLPIRTVGWCPVPVSSLFVFW